MSKPELVEPGMKYFMNMALINSRKIKFNYYNFWINLICFVVFTLGLTIWLMDRYRGNFIFFLKLNNMRQFINMIILLLIYLNGIICKIIL